MHINWFRYKYDLDGLKSNLISCVPEEVKHLVAQNFQGLSIELITAKHSALRVESARRRNWEVRTNTHVGVDWFLVCLGFIEFKTNRKRRFYTNTMYFYFSVKSSRDIWIFNTRKTCWWTKCFLQGTNQKKGTNQKQLGR